MKTQMIEIGKTMMNAALMERRRNDEVIPMWATITSSKIHIDHTPMNDENRMLIVQDVCAKAKENKAEALIHMTDAWIRTGEDLGTPDDPDFVPPDQALDGVEAFLIQASSKDENFMMIRAYRQTDDGDFEILWDETYPGSNGDIVEEMQKVFA